ncbi:hypothetical protein PGT21_006209 [Puccinia graminis f. sp. tritici]|uniref:Uncharacterized protein n=1 Tax=Puccinia graminis f. sp. tritici TaxID=56615 RepID=A0A5B0PN62_PUCGR|nr:hypothetical protein PGT21_006209 [Puccinia graminis f. sp. tritici]
MIPRRPSPGSIETFFHGDRGPERLNSPVGPSLGNQPQVAPGIVWCQRFPSDWTLPSDKRHINLKPLPPMVRQPSWSGDGVDGGPSSITVLLNWLATNNNYVRWRQGESKRDLSSEILMEMRRNGIQHRDYHDDITPEVSRPGIKMGKYDGFGRHSRRG